MYHHSAVQKSCISTYRTYYFFRTSGRRGYFYANLWGSFDTCQLVPPSSTHNVFDDRYSIALWLPVYIHLREFSRWHRRVPLASKVIALFLCVDFRLKVEGRGAFLDSNIYFLIYIIFKKKVAGALSTLSTWIRQHGNKGVVLSCVCRLNVG